MGEHGSRSNRWDALLSAALQCLVMDGPWRHDVSVSIFAGGDVVTMDGRVQDLIMHYWQTYDGIWKRAPATSALWERKIHENIGIDHTGLTWRIAPRVFSRVEAQHRIQDNLKRIFEKTGSVMVLLLDWSMYDATYDELRAAGQGRRPESMQVVVLLGGAHGFDGKDDRQSGFDQSLATWCKRHFGPQSLVRVNLGVRGTPVKFTSASAASFISMEWSRGAWQEAVAGAERLARSFYVPVSNTQAPGLPCESQVRSCQFPSLGGVFASDEKPDACELDFVGKVAATGTHHSAEHVVFSPSATLDQQSSRPRRASLTDGVQKSGWFPTHFWSAETSELSSAVTNDDNDSHRDYPGGLAHPSVWLDCSTRDESCSTDASSAACAWMDRDMVCRGLSSRDAECSLAVLKRGELPAPSPTDAFCVPESLMGRAIASFDGREHGPEYISFSKGDAVEFWHACLPENDWACGQSRSTCNGEVGWFPSVFVDVPDVGTACSSFDGVAYGSGYLTLMTGDWLYRRFSSDGSKWSYGVLLSCSCERAERLPLRQGWFPRDSWRRHPQHQVERKRPEL